jgi:hypothetical protein
MKNSKEVKIVRGIDDEELRRRVKALAGLGLRQKQICSIVEIRSPKTLRKRFARDLSAGIVEARAKVMQAVFKSATSGRDPRMTMFWLKTRARWSEKTSPESYLCEERFIVRDYVSKPQEPPKAARRKITFKDHKPEEIAPREDESGDDTEENE